MIIDFEYPIFRLEDFFIFHYNDSCYIELFCDDCARVTNQLSVENFYKFTCEKCSTTNWFKTQDRTKKGIFRGYEIQGNEPKQLMFQICYNKQFYIKVGMDYSNLDTILIDPDKINEIYQNYKIMV